MTILALSGAIQLVPDGTMLFHLVLIIVMVAIVNATLLKPINRILEEREKKTKGRFSEAQQALGSVQERLSEYERHIREARAGGYKLLETERAAASEQHNQKLAAVRSEVGEWREREKAMLNVAEKEAKARLASDARTTAAEISARILGRSVSST
jgi:F-type H+-transporting ATPase subunit b